MLFIKSQINSSFNRAIYSHRAILFSWLSKTCCFDLYRCPSRFGSLLIWSPWTKSTRGYGHPWPISASRFGPPGGPNLLADMVSPRGFGPLVILIEERKSLFLQCFFVLPRHKHLWCQYPLRWMVLIIKDTYWAVYNSWIMRKMKEKQSSIFSHFWSIKTH